MKALLLLLTLLLAPQGNRPEFGTIRGRLTTINGGPASMVRIALVSPDTADPITELLNISRTDAAGSYELVNVPPGRYRILAGPVNSATYYPGVATPDQARIVTILAGQVVPDLSFPVLPGLTGALGTTVFAGAGTVTGKVRVDDSTPLPSSNAPAFLEVNVNGSFAARANNPTGTFMLQLGPREHRVTLGPLWLGFYLKSITYGNVDLTKAALTLPASSNPTEVEIVLTKTRPENAPRGARVTGHVTRGEGALTRTPPIELLNVSSGRVVYAATLVLAENDTFSIEDVPPGRYRFGPAAPPRWLEFTVGADDVTGLTFHLGAPDTVVPLNSNLLRTVQGTVEGPSETIPPFEIAFIPARTAAAAHVATISAREFSVSVPEGEYRVSVSGLPDRYAVESVTAGPLDLTSAFLLTSTGIADRFMGKGSAVGIKIRLKPVDK